MSHGRCDEAATLPYQPFVEAVDQLLRYLPNALPDHTAAALAPLLPRVGRHATERGAGAAVHTDPAQARHRMVEAIDAVLSAPSTAVVLVVEDIHWADRSSPLVLRHLLRHGGRSPLLVVGTARSEGLATGLPLAEELAETERGLEVPELRLTGLGRRCPAGRSPPG